MALTFGQYKECVVMRIELESTESLKDNDGKILHVTVHFRLFGTTRIIQMSGHLNLSEDEYGDGSEDYLESLIREIISNDLSEVISTSLKEEVAE